MTAVCSFRSDPEIKCSFRVLILVLRDEKYITVPPQLAQETLRCPQWWTRQRPKPQVALPALWSDISGSNHGKYLLGIGSTEVIPWYFIVARHGVWTARSDLQGAPRIRSSLGLGCPCTPINQSAQYELSDVGVSIPADQILFPRGHSAGSWWTKMPYNYIRHYRVQMSLARKSIDELPATKMWLLEKIWFQYVRVYRSTISRVERVSLKIHHPLRHSYGIVCHCLFWRCRFCALRASTMALNLCGCVRHWVRWCKSRTSKSWNILVPGVLFRSSPDVAP